MKLTEKCNEYEVYDIGNGYTVIKENCFWFPNGYRFRFHYDLNSYLPDIFDNRDNKHSDSGLSFEVQTTSYGALPPKEIEKVIKGYQAALDTIELVKEAFETQEKEGEGTPNETIS